MQRGTIKELEVGQRDVTQSDDMIEIQEVDQSNHDQVANEITFVFYLATYWIYSGSYTYLQYKLLIYKASYLHYLYIYMYIGKICSVRILQISLRDYCIIPIGCLSTELS